MNLSKYFLQKKVNIVKFLYKKYILIKVVINYDLITRNIMKKTMIHKLNLHKTPFNLIKSWVKTIESRLFDEKRQKIKIWDEITFVSREDWDIINTEVLKFYKSGNFLELSKIIDLEKTWDKSGKEFLNSLEIYYNKDQQEKYWVIAIEFKLI